VRPSLASAAGGAPAAAASAESQKDAFFTRQSSHRTVGRPGVRSRRRFRNRGVNLFMNPVQRRQMVLQRENAAEPADLIVASSSASQFSSATFSDGPCATKTAQGRPESRTKCGPLAWSMDYQPTH
jgi:hypothetical protein